MEAARQSIKNQLAAPKFENKFSSTMTRIGFIIQTSRIFATRLPSGLVVKNQKQVFALITRKWNKKDKWRKIVRFSAPRCMYASAERKIFQRASIWRRFGWKFTVAYLSFEYFSCLLNYTLINISNRRWVQGFNMLSVGYVDFYGGNRRNIRILGVCWTSKSKR